LAAGQAAGDASKVPVIRYPGMQSRAEETAQNQSIEAAMPTPGCRYTLVSVLDRGQQGKEWVPAVSSDSSTYRFDMVVDELCPGKPTLGRLGLSP
jgi:hypothetical protein